MVRFDQFFTRDHPHFHACFYFHAGATHFINMAAERALSSVNGSFQSIEENLERFISYDKKHSATILSVLRDIFNYSKTDEAICGRKIGGCPFESLQFDPTNFDNEILWQQIQLQNESLLPKLRTESKPLLKKANSVHLNDVNLKFNGKNEKNLNEVRNSMESVEGSTSSAEETEVDNFVQENSDDNEELQKTSKSKMSPVGSGKPKGSVVDDQFFKLAEMERFLESKHGGDNMSADESDESIDYFTDLNKGDHTMSDVERYSLGSPI